MTLAMDIPQKATGDPDEILALSVNPADRFWRYPICNFVVKWLAKTPLTPNHITIVHTALSVGAGFIIAIGTTRAFIVAGIMFETRSVLDCLDGVLARATGKSSPFGRALDQLGDTIGFLSLMGGALVCIARLYGWWAGLATIFLTMPISGSCSTAWDLYRRRFYSLMKVGYDTTEEEHLLLCKRFQEKRMVSLWVSRTVANWGWHTLSPQTVPRLRERIAKKDWPVEGVTPHTTEVGRRIQEAAARNDPELRGMLLRLAIVAGDNIILLFTVSLLLGHYLEAFPVAMVWGVLIWVYTVVTINRYFDSLQPALKPEPAKADR